MALSALSVLAVVLVAPGTSEAEDSSLRFFYLGGAFGTSVRVGSPFVTGSSVVAGSTAHVALGCTTEQGIKRSNTVASVNTSPSVVSGTVLTTAETIATETTATDTSPAGTVRTSRTTARTQVVNLLDGLITADVARAVSSTSHGSNGFQVTGADSYFENLVIRDRPPQSVKPGPNTEVELFGFGRAILNEQVSTVLGSSAVLSVNAIHVFITTPNELAIPVGTEIVVSHAKSGLVGPVTGVLGGEAYGSSIDVAGTVHSGPSALRAMPCPGTDGEDKTNSTASVVIPDILASGVVADTVRGTVGPTSSSGRTISTTEAVDLLRGVVRATGVQAQANTSSTASGRTFGDGGSAFATLVVRDNPSIDANVPPNTTLSLPGLGTLHLRRVLRTATSIEVRMIELVVTDASNPQGLPVGLDVRIGVARVAVA